MPNWSQTSYVIKGDKRQVDSLYRIMKNLENMETSLLDNGFGTTWLGNLVHRLGANPSQVYCRGYWSNLDKKKGQISFDCEHAWARPYEVEDLIKEKYEDLEIYFITEELGMGIFETNDDFGEFFTSTVIIDCEESGTEYYTDEEAIKALSELTGRAISSWEEAEDAVQAYNSSINLEMTEVGHIWVHRVEYVSGY